MWTNCLGGKQAGKYKTLGHISLHFKANYIHNIINLTYRRPTCKICATFKRLPGLYELESFAYADFGILQWHWHWIWTILREKLRLANRIMKYHSAYGWNFGFLLPNAKSYQIYWREPLINLSITCTMHYNGHKDTNVNQYR